MLSAELAPLTIQIYCQVSRQLHFSVAVVFSELSALILSAVRVSTVAQRADQNENLIGAGLETRLIVFH